MADTDGVLAARDATPAPPASPHGDVAEHRRGPDAVTKSPRFAEVPEDSRDVGQGDADAGGGPGGVGRLLEDCYPPRREDEVRALRRQRDQHYQLDLLRQIEDKRRDRQQRRREDIRSDLQRLGRQDRRDEYLRQLHEEQQQQLRQQLRSQLQREEQREAQRMQQVAEVRDRQRDQLRGQQGLGPAPAGLDAGADRGHDHQVQQLSEQLARQHLPDDAVADAPAALEPENTPLQDASPAVAEGPSSRAPAPESDPADIAAGVADRVALDKQRPWNHYRPLQKELDRRRRERAAAAAAREAAAARRAEADEHARMEVEYRRYLDWRLRTRRPGPPAQPSARMEAARRWGEARRQASLQLRADRDGRLAEWRRAKEQQDQERRRAASAAQRAAQEAALEKQRRSHDGFARWLDTIHERRLADKNAGPVGATGVTTYEAFHAVPWTNQNKAVRAGARPARGARQQ